MSKKNYIKNTILMIGVIFSLNFAITNITYANPFTSVSGTPATSTQIAASNQGSGPNKEDPKATGEDANFKCNVLNCNEIAKPSGGSVETTGIWKLLIMALGIMTVLVGLLATGGIIWASLMYASAADNAEQTKKAKNMIFQIVIGLILYAFMYLILNFLIPGGIFS